jgi:hypothetical protein
VRVCCVSLCAKADAYAEEEEEEDDDDAEEEEVEVGTPGEEEARRERPPGLLERRVRRLRVRGILMRARERLRSLSLACPLTLASVIVLLGVCMLVASCEVSSGPAGVGSLEETCVLDTPANAALECRRV